MTHAIIFLFKCGIKGYLTYNAFALPFAIAVLAEVNRFMFKKPIYVDVYAITVAVLNFVYYLLVNFI